MSRIKNVIPKEDYCLEVHLDNGSSIILNLESRLQTLRFSMLSDMTFFKAAATDGTCIRWDNKIEISLNEVLQMALKKAVKNNNEKNEKNDGLHDHSDTDLFSDWLRRRSTCSNRCQ